MSPPLSRSRRASQSRSRPSACAGGQHAGPSSPGGRSAARESGSVTVSDGVLEMTPRTQRALRAGCATAGEVRGFRRMMHPLAHLLEDFLAGEHVVRLAKNPGSPTLVPVGPVVSSLPACPGGYASLLAVRTSHPGELMRRERLLCGSRQRRRRHQLDHRCRRFPLASTRAVCWPATRLSNAESTSS